jgi:short-subunit dehydrogenase involved in D-alanine esterification of teichoic acids
MRTGLAYLEAAEKCRQLARQVVIEPRKKKQLEDMALEWEVLATERVTQLAKRNKRGGAM